MLAIEARQFILTDEVPLANVLEELNVRHELLDERTPTHPPGMTPTSATVFLAPTTRPCRIAG